MARRNPQDTIQALRDELAEAHERNETLEDTVDRLSGRLERIASAADVASILEAVDSDDENSDDEDSDDENED